MRIKMDQLKANESNSEAKHTVLPSVSVTDPESSNSILTQTTATSTNNNCELFCSGLI